MTALQLFTALYGATGVLFFFALAGAARTARATHGLKSPATLFWAVGIMLAMAWPLTCVVAVFAATVQIVKKALDEET